MFGLFGSSRQNDKPKVPSTIGGNLNSGIGDNAPPNSLSLQSTHKNLSDGFPLTNPFDMGGFLATHHFPLKIESKDVVYERYVAHINALNHTIMLRNANVGTAHLNACHCDCCAPRYLKSA